MMFPFVTEQGCARGHGAMETFRKLVPTDLNSLHRHLLALGPEQRQMRFHGSVSDIAIERYCRDIDWFRTITLGYFVGSRLRGAVQLTFDRPWLPRRGELAITVETPWQGRGVGTELTRRALTIARNRGVAHLVITCLVENGPMRRIARKLGGALRFNPGTVAADVELRNPDAFTFFEELIADSCAAAAAMFEPLAGDGDLATSDRSQTSLS